MNEPLVLACDLGGTKTLAGLFTHQGRLLAAEKHLIGARAAPAAVLDDLAGLLDKLLAASGRRRDDVTAVGLGSPGVPHAASGVIAMTHNLGWRDVDLSRLAAQRLGLPVVLEMDANAAALGEFWQGAGRGLEHFLFVIVGTGVGAGIVLNGRIVHGAHRVAGELGHTVILPGGPLCGCGKHGCLEALASGLALSRRAEAAVKLGRATALSQCAAGITGQQVTDAAQAGDAVAREIIAESAFYLGIGLANVITLLDPQAVIIGGGVGAGAFELLQAPLNQSVQQHLNYWAARSIPIRPSALGEYAGLYGAAWAALNIDLYPDSNEVKK